MPAPTFGTLGDWWTYSIGHVIQHNLIHFSCVMCAHHYRGCSVVKWFADLVFLALIMCCNHIANFFCSIIPLFMYPMNTWHTKAIAGNWHGKVFVQFIFHLNNVLVSYSFTFSHNHHIHIGNKGVIKAFNVLSRIYHMSEAGSESRSFMATIWNIYNTFQVSKPCWYGFAGYYQHFIFRIGLFNSTYKEGGVGDITRVNNGEDKGFHLISLNFFIP